MTNTWVNDSTKRPFQTIGIIGTGRIGTVTAQIMTGFDCKVIAYDLYPNPQCEAKSALFFEDRSNRILQDDTFARLMTFPNVIITGHQAFFTEDAMQPIAEMTLSNITQIEQKQTCENAI